ncbi:MAG: GNAT family N-acetyltransferase [Bacteroidota bacterium]
METKRLVLREAELKDVPFILSNHSNDRVMKYLGSKRLDTMTEAENLIQDAKEAFKNKEGIRWAITHKKEDQYMGSIGFWKLDKKNGIAEIGYELSPDYWGRGYMTEALEVVLRFGFDRMLLRGIEANVDPQNEASGKVLRKMGFVATRYGKGTFSVKGKMIDTIVFELPRELAELSREID